MTHRLVILCSSARPDPYFNVISHAVLTRDIKNFVLVAIGDEINPEQSDMAAQIADDLSSFVQALKDGQYWRRDSRDGSVHLIDLGQPESFNGVLERLKWGSLQVERLGTSEDGLRELLAKESKAGSSFDVTACKNSAVAGAAAWLVSQGGSTIYTFELRKQPTFDEGDLVPSMAPHDYVYRELSATGLMRDATRAVNAFTVKKRTFTLGALSVAALVGLVSLSFSNTVAFSLVTGLASFASIMSALIYFVRD